MKKVCYHLDMGHKWKHKRLKESIQDYADWYINFLIENGYHPSRKQRMKFAGRNSVTLNAWEHEMVGLKMAEKVDRGSLGSILLFPGVYFVDDRGEKNDMET